MNEELPSTREERATSKKDLQSLNEELSTLNSQLADKVQELEGINNDLGNLLDSMDIAMVLLDRRLNMRRYTPAAERLFSLTPSDVGRAMVDITPSFDATDLLDDARKVLAGIEVKQQEVQTKDDLFYLRRILPYYSEDDTVNAIVITFTEITGRKEAELALAEKEALFDAAPIGIFVGRDIECRDMAMNRAGAQMLRLPDDINPSLSGPQSQALSFRVYHDGRELPAHELPMQVAARRGERVEGFEEELRFDDGEVKKLITYAAPLRDADGHVYGCVGTFADITALRQAETRYHETLEQLAEADRRKDEFLSMLGHELRNPLAPLRNALSVLEIAGVDEDRMVWALQMIDRQTRHLERLVDDLLDTARITRGAVRLKMEPVDLCAAVYESVEATESAVRQREHHLEVELPDEPVMMMGDITRLVQILTNLINNAVKYTNTPGSIRLCLAQEGLNQGATACMTLEDNGRGIAPEDLPHIFEVFSKGPQSLARDDGGLGLGLPLVKKLVEMHGGTVAAESLGVGQGSRFVVRLPKIIGASAGIDTDRDGSSAESTLPAATTPKRILLADDNRDVLESLRFFFQVLGHEVWDVPAGEPVFDLVERVRPDVVILDIGLPDIDGIEVAGRLAQLPYRRAMKVIALSGYVEQVVDSELFDAHVLKGSNTEKLLQFL